MDDHVEKARTKARETFRQGRLIGREQNGIAESHNGQHALAEDEPPMPWPEPPAPAAYHGLAGDIVRAIQPHSEADPVALLIQTLIAFGNLIARTAYFTAEEDRHYLNEFVVLVGKTSKGRKGSSWGRVRRLFGEAEELW